MPGAVNKAANNLLRKRDPVDDLYFELLQMDIDPRLKNHLQLIVGEELKRVHVRNRKTLDLQDRILTQAALACYIHSRLLLHDLNKAARGTPKYERLARGYISFTAAMNKTKRLKAVMGAPAVKKRKVFLSQRRLTGAALSPYRTEGEPEDTESDNLDYVNSEAEGEDIDAAEA